MTDRAPTPDATTTADVEAHRLYSDEKLKKAITIVEDALAQLRDL
jgi:hypothetical protein